MSSQKDASAEDWVRKNGNGLRSCVRGVVGELRKRCQKPRINAIQCRWGKCGARPARASVDAQCRFLNGPATAGGWTVERRNSAAAPQASWCASRIARTTNTTMCTWSARNSWKSPSAVAARPSTSPRGSFEEDLVVSLQLGHVDRPRTSVFWCLVLSRWLHTVHGTNSLRSQAVGLSLIHI